jgi:hypothetical protein
MPTGHVLGRQGTQARPWGSSVLLSDAANRILVQITASTRSIDSNAVPGND